MRRSQLPPIVTVLAVSILCCGSPPVRSSPGLSPSGNAQDQTGAADPTGFVDRVWRVAESPQVQTGSLRVFLSDGTLVMADPHAEPAFGTWAMDAGKLTITEESLTYPVEILELSEQVFRIRIRGPGEPVDIRFEPATKPTDPPGAGHGWVELDSETAGPTIRITGTMQHKTVEGGVWVIRTDEGSFQPLNLPPEFHVEGMAVEADAVRRSDMVSIHMVGPLVELLRIRQHGAPAPTR
ncbi:MAG: hypothetical protein ACRD2Z_01610 [Thermoanaerobaculia bacterium]